MRDDQASEISKAESSTCTELRPILGGLPVGSPIPESDLFRSALSGLERFLPQALCEVHAEWGDESLDGIYPAVARKTGELEIEIVGLCILIGDQTLTPLHLQLQLDSTSDAVSWLDCRLGETTSTGMLRIPYSNESKWNTKLYTLADHLDEIDWTYHVGYGKRRS